MLMLTRVLIAIILFTSVVLAYTHLDGLLGAIFVGIPFVLFGAYGYFLGAFDKTLLDSVQKTDKEDRS